MGCGCAVHVPRVRDACCVRGACTSRGSRVTSLLDEDASVVLVDIQAETALRVADEHDRLVVVRVPRRRRRPRRRRPHRRRPLGQLGRGRRRRPLHGECNRVALRVLDKRPHTLKVDPRYGQAALVDKWRRTHAQNEVAHRYPVPFVKHSCERQRVVLSNLGDDDARGLQADCETKA